MQFRSTQLLVLAILALSIGGCRKQSGEIITKPTSSATIADSGDFKLRYQPRKSLRKSDAAHRVGENEPAIAAVIADLNNKLILPFDIVISMQDCDEPDAYYEPETHEVVICHQLIDEYYDLFARKIKDKTKLDDAVRGATASTFFHELGHALSAWRLGSSVEQVVIGPDVVEGESRPLYIYAERSEKSGTSA